MACMFPSDLPVQDSNSKPELTQVSLDHFRQFVEGLREAYIEIVIVNQYLQFFMTMDYIEVDFQYSVPVEISLYSRTRDSRYITIISEGIEKIELDRSTEKNKTRYIFSYKSGESTSYTFEKYDSLS